MALLNKSMDAPGHGLHISEFTGIQATDISLGRFWGLIERHPDKKGCWRPTQLLVLWAQGRLAIPEELTFNGGGATVKYSPGSKYIMITDVPGMTAPWVASYWDHQKSSLPLYSRDWCGGAKLRDEGFSSSAAIDIVHQGKTIRQRLSEEYPAANG